MINSNPFDGVTHIWEKRTGRCLGLVVKTGYMVEGASWFAAVAGYGMVWERQINKEISIVAPGYKPPECPFTVGMRLFFSPRHPRGFTGLAGAVERVNRHAVNKNHWLARTSFSNIINSFHLDQNEITIGQRAH